MDSLEKYYHSCCAQNIKAIVDGTDNTKLVETIRGLEARIPEYDTKYIKVFYLSSDFVALILTFKAAQFQGEERKFVKVQVDDREIMFTRVESYDEWSSMVKQFYVYMKSTVSKECIQVCKTRMEKSSQMWKRHSEYLTKRNAP